MRDEAALARRPNQAEFSVVANLHNAVVRVGTHWAVAVPEGPASEGFAPQNSALRIPVHLDSLHYFEGPILADGAAGIEQAMQKADRSEAFG
tara:strand:- start:104 stop:379 length:276 start_codon:yes stop_codon:yes gene_type:complete